MKRKYCQFCGAPVSKLSMNQGVYLSNSCPEPSCPAHGDEQDNEFTDLDDAYLSHLNTAYGEYEGDD
jgi:hypothetical protein